MCYSAKVKQNLKELSRRFDASIDLKAFQAIFKERLAGSGAKISRAMEASFDLKSSNKIEKQIAEDIAKFREKEIFELQTNLFAQKKRLADAEKQLKTKVTKKAENEIRVATNKIESFKNKLDRLQSKKISEGDSRIFPSQYAPLIVFEDGKRVIRPFRYLLRPKGQPESFDRKYNGAYNVRRDRIQEVFWWKSIFGKNHGVLVIDSFSENVKRHNYEKRALKKGEKEENMVLHFKPRDLDLMTVPCIFDQNDEGKLTLHSFALITDDPNPEVAAAGHDRTPVIMKEKHMDLWLNTKNVPLENYEVVFTDKQPTYFNHQIAA